MARRKEFFCSIHGGPFVGRGWGGHLSRGCKGLRMSEEEYAARRRRPAGAFDPLVRDLRQRMAQIDRQIAELQGTREKIISMVQTLEGR
jgi:hypothetical protein